MTCSCCCCRGDATVATWVSQYRLTGQPGVGRRSCVRGARPAAAAAARVGPRPAAPDCDNSARAAAKAEGKKRLI